MKIKALVPFSTGTITMEQYEVKEVTDTIGEQLVAAGVAVEIGGGSGGGVLIVHSVDGTLDKTWQEIQDASVGGTICFVMDDADGVIVIQLVTAVFTESEAYYACIGAEGTASYIEYMASSVDDYPVSV